MSINFTTPEWRLEPVHHPLWLPLVQSILALDFPGCGYAHWAHFTHIDVRDLCCLWMNPFTTHVLECIGTSFFLLQGETTHYLTFGHLTNIVMSASGSQATLLLLSPGPCSMVFSAPILARLWLLFYSLCLLLQLRDLHGMTPVPGSPFLTAIVDTCQKKLPGADGSWWPSSSSGASFCLFWSFSYMNRRCCFILTF